MIQYIKNLYKKFLYNRISHDEMLEMRYFMKDIGSENLTSVVEEEWNDGDFAYSMDNHQKEDLKKSLDLYIEFDKKRRKRSVMTIAAAVLIPAFIIISVVLIKNLPTTPDSDFIVYVERGNKAMVTLPDETKVWLNSNTTIKYNQNQADFRYVQLEGEAFFKVKEDKSKPFVVTLGDLEIEVLGTSFNAKARAYSDVVETSLVEGKIKISSENLFNNYYLNEAEKAVYNKRTKELLKFNTDNELETAWMYNRLKFSSERIEDVLLRLEEWYGVKIINKQIGINNDIISGTFIEEHIEHAIQALQLQYKNLQYTSKQDTIVLY